jgi:putative flippase GtrA
MAEDIVQKLLRFYSLAVLNTIIGISTLVMFNAVLGSSFALGNILLSNTIVQLVAHQITRKFIWKSKQPYFRELMKFSATYVPSALFSIIAFLSQKHLVFRNDKK